VKRLHRAAANRRPDALRKPSRKPIDRYPNIYGDDVSTQDLDQARMATSPNRGCTSGSIGLRQLAVPHWACSGSGAPRDRDVDAAKNIRTSWVPVSDLRQRDRVRFEVHR
jgi:hypothetical protein